MSNKKTRWVLFSGQRTVGKTALLQEDFEKKIEEARQVLYNNNVPAQRYNLIFPKYMYERMTQTERRHYFKTHPDCDIYFLESLSTGSQKALKLTRSGGLKAVSKIRGK